MNSLCEFIGSSSGLAPMRQGLGLGGVISVLVGLAVLFGAREAAEADKCGYRNDPVCGYSGWCASKDESKPFRHCEITQHPDCSFDISCSCSSTPCSEDAQELVVTDIVCGYSGWCASRDESKPFRHCEITSVGLLDICFCSSTPCSATEQEQPTAVLTLADARPAQHELGNAYPNPFNPAMVIPLDLATDQKQVHLAVYDVLGHRVRQLRQGPLGAGRHRFVWDGRNEAGKAVAAGVYIYKVEVDGWIEAKKATKLP